MSCIPGLFIAALLTAQGVPEAPVPSAVASSRPIELSVQILDSKGEVPRSVQAGDLMVLEDGQLRPVVELAPLSLPWRIAIYVDRVLTGSRTLRAAAGALAERAAELAALGTVEVIVAEPQPRLALGATRNVKAIDEALSKLWLTGEGRDDVRLLRQRFQDGQMEEQIGEAEEGDDSADRVQSAIGSEERLVRRQLDALTEWLVAQESGGPRVLLVVSDGFDVDPARFYRPLSTGTEPAAEGALEKVALASAQTAAALGWTALPLPMGNSALPDLRRLRNRPTPQTPIGGTITLGRKKPPAGPAETRPALPALLAPEQPLTWLAESTGGEVLREPHELTGALTRLRSRFWLRYEAPRELDGRSRDVAVQTARPDLTLKARRWDVAGIPEAVGVARARRLLDGEEDGGGLEISVRIQPAGDAGEGTLDLRLESPDVSHPLRLTVAGPDGGTVLHHILTAADLAGSEPGVYRLAAPLPEEEDTVAVIVEPLDGGAWGGQMVALGGAPEPEAISVSGPALRLVPPPGNALVGKVRLRVNGGGGEIARVELRLGERPAGSCEHLPCEAEVDLGRRVRPQVLQALAYDAAGRELARDVVRINETGGAFQVRIVEPAVKKGVGPVDVEADVRMPSGKRVESVEFYWNDELAGTVYAPPYRHRVMVPRSQPVGYLRVAARLDDGSTAEDAVALNASDIADRIDVQLIELAVVVTDAAGKPVPGLPKEAFRVRQDGREQEIAAFENAGELPLSLALAIDSSASMFLKLPDVSKAVASLLVEGLGNRDRAMLIDFDTEPRLVKPVTRDLEAVSSSLRALAADGGTALWDAVTFALTQLRGISGRKALVIYSDGIDEGGRFSFSSCLSAARGSGIPIYLIVANPRAARGEDGGFLSEPSSAKFKRLADAGGGQVYFIQPNQDLSGVYRQILSELRSQYTLGFYPPETASLEGWRKIEVEVKGERGLTARTVSELPAHP